MEVTYETIIGDIVDFDEDTADIFLECGMHCIDCPVSRMETWIMLASELQPLKALRPILTSLVGISTYFSDLQPSKVDSSISPILQESFTPSSEKQFENALNSTSTQLSGIATSTRLKQ